MRCSPHRPSAGQLGRHRLGRRQRPIRRKRSQMKPQDGVCRAGMTLRSSRTLARGWWATRASRRTTRRRRCKPMHSTARPSMMWSSRKRRLAQTSRARSRKDARRAPSGRHARGVAARSARPVVGPSHRGGHRATRAGRLLAIVDRRIRHVDGFRAALVSRAWRRRGVRTRGYQRAYRRRDASSKKLRRAHWPALRPHAGANPGSEDDAQPGRESQSCRTRFARRSLDAISRDRTE